MDFSSILIIMAIFVTPHVAGNVLQSDRCPPTFELQGDGCYKVMTLKVSWPVAKVCCQIIGGELAQITSPSVQAIIGGLVDRNKDANGRYWVDGSDVLRTRVWRWMGTDGNSILFSYTNWQPGEPNNISDNCVEVRRDNSSMWNDEKCTSTLGFICQASSRKSD